MIALYLIAAHMAGDYLFQSSWMAANKLTNPKALLLHVCTYSACFIPVAVIYSPDWRHAYHFMAGLWVTHLATDAKRWRTSNPWPAMPILQDQSLHAVQLAILGGLFL